MGWRTQVEERVLIKDKHPVLGLPLLRGVFKLLLLHVSTASRR
ncbi:MAG: hypothetical protein ACLRWQ_18310 [Flavonifractor plautii]